MDYDNPTSLKTRGEVPEPDDTGDRPEKVPREILRPAYIQRLPEWVYEHPGYRGLSAGQRFALHVLAWKADKPDAAGNLVGAFTGDLIREMIGCGKSAFWEWVGEFERYGFAVVISRGGGRLGNVIGIPGLPGALDARRIARRTTPNGKGGAKPAKYERASVRETDTNASVRNTDATRPRNGRHPSADRTPPVRETDTTIPLGHLSKPTPSPSGAGGGGDLPGFAGFWSRYPKQIDEDQARVVWQDQQLEASADQIIASIAKWKASEKWQEKGGQFIPQPANFLAKGYWKSPPASATPEAPPGYFYYGDAALDAFGPTRSPTAEELAWLCEDHDGFVKFWKVWPDHPGKDEAREECKNYWVRHQMGDGDRAIKALGGFLSSPEWKAGNIPSPLQWIRELREGPAERNRTTEAAKLTDRDLAKQELARMRQNRSPAPITPAGSTYNINEDPDVPF